MATITEQFEQASRDVKNLSNRPDNDTMLRLYALYKQGSEGDVAGPEPGIFDFVASAKYHAWAKMEGMKPEMAMKKYIDLVNSLVV